MPGIVQLPGAVDFLSKGLLTGSRLATQQAQTKALQTQNQLQAGELQHQAQRFALEDEAKSAAIDFQNRQTEQAQMQLDAHLTVLDTELRAKEALINSQVANANATVAQMKRSDAMQPGNITAQGLDADASRAGTKAVKTRTKRDKDTLGVDIAGKMAAREQTEAITRATGSNVSIRTQAAQREADKHQDNLRIVEEQRVQLETARLEHNVDRAMKIVGMALDPTPSKEESDELAMLSLGIESMTPEAELVSQSHLARSQQAAQEQQIQEDLARELAIMRGASGGLSNRRADVIEDPAVKRRNDLNAKRMGELEEDLAEAKSSHSDAQKFEKSYVPDSQKFKDAVEDIADLEAEISSIKEGLGFEEMSEAVEGLLDGGDIPRVKTLDAARRLKPGTQFYDPNGALRTR